MEFRRASHLVLYWEDETLVLRNYATGRSLKTDPFILQVLEGFSTWRRLDDYVSGLGPDVRPTVERLVDALHAHGWLRRRDDAPDPVEHGLDQWGAWNPAAGFFHSASRSTRFVELDHHVEHLRHQAETWPMPAPTKSYEEARVSRLPKPNVRGAFPRVLTERRTWRRFGRAPVDLEPFSTLLHLTAGVQSWITAKGEGRVPLKTAPSGGARHPIEVYVLARRVRSLEPGIYHYASDQHVLERVPGSAKPPAFDAILPTQWWYRDAAALVLFTAVFERTRWRYRSPRAYRAVLLEAGHVCQTFCLTATWLGLAPFCSMAIADAVAEKTIGIDGVSEAVLYAAGVGSRPVLRRGMPGSIPPRT
ncbi:MAG TPA: SagB family peptide dehydrogenase [Vicinamibacterales bacterium]